MERSASFCTWTKLLLVKKEYWWLLNGRRVPNIVRIIVFFSDQSGGSDGLVASGVLALSQPPSSSEGELKWRVLETIRRLLHQEQMLQTNKIVWPLRSTETLCHKEGGMFTDDAII